MPKAKRHSLSLSKEVMTFFKECHAKIGARSIGQSVKETILNLRRELEKNKSSEDPLTDPFTGKPLSKREVAHIDHIRKDKGFATTKEAFAYFRGHIEQSIEKRLGAKALKQPLNEAPQSQGTPIHPCPFYKYDDENDKVLCSRDLKKRNVMHRIPQGICDMCWNRQVEGRQEQAGT